MDEWDFSDEVSVIRQRRSRESGITRPGGGTENEMKLSTLTALICLTLVGHAGIRMAFTKPAEVTPEQKTARIVKAAEDAFFFKNKLCGISLGGVLEETREGHDTIVLEGPAAFAVYKGNISPDGGGYVGESADTTYFWAEKGRTGSATTSDGKTVYFICE